MIPYEHYSAAAEFIRAAFPAVPAAAVVLGSGMGGLTEELRDKIRLSYKSIPHFPYSTNASHAGELYFGLLSGTPVLIFSGRCHVYEGYTMEQAAFYVRVLSLLGVKRLILTNAAGGVNPDFAVGDLMLIEDHIKLAMESPSAGIYEPRFGRRFFDMTSVYSRNLISAALSAAEELDFRLQQGVYFYFAGPQYETPAEIRAARILGADAVGMSTVPEVIAAAEAEMEVLAFSLITNMAAGITGKPLSDDEVVAEAHKAGLRLSSLLREILCKLK